MLSAFRLFLLLPFAAGNFHQSGNVFSSNISAPSSGFRFSRLLQDGEFQRVTTWPGFCAKETSVDWGEIDVTLREVWLIEEKRKLQLIYEGGTLSDCFDEKLKSGMGEAYGSDDATEECLSKLHSKELRENVGEDEQEGSDQDDEGIVEVLSQEDFSHQRIADWFVSADELRQQCFRVRTRTRNQVLARQGQSKYEALQIGMADKSKRKLRRGRGRGKRDLLLIPGTQWCGRGHRATKYTNLGGFSIADACCRRHDTTCPFFIPAFQTKYNLFNWGVSTLMHCACDERFRTCLKMAGTSSANFVGKLFFNVVQTKCFVLKPQKTCLQRSWWGKCELHEYRKQAHLRDNVPY